MADRADYAYQPPGGAAYSTPNWSGDYDKSAEREPPNMDVGTRDVIFDQRRLSGARGLPNLKERGT